MEENTDICKTMMKLKPPSQEEGSSRLVLEATPSLKEIKDTIENLEKHMETTREWIERFYPITKENSKKEPITLEKLAEKVELNNRILVSIHIETKNIKFKLDNLGEPGSVTEYDMDSSDDDDDFSRIIRFNRIPRLQRSLSTCSSHSKVELLRENLKIEDDKNIEDDSNSSETDDEDDTDSD